MEDTEESDWEELEISGWLIDTDRWEEREIILRLMLFETQGKIDWSCSEQQHPELLWANTTVYITCCPCKSLFLVVNMIKMLTSGVLRSD